MGSPKMKLLWQLTLIAGLSYSDLAQECDPETSNCCQQVSECNGICSIEHPEPDNAAAWYSHSFCEEKSGCRCWNKGQCCEVENRKCKDDYNGTCTLGTPPKDTNFEALFHCDEKADQKPGCLCWQRKRCEEIMPCEDPKAICQHYKPTLPGKWKDTGYCNWLTDCKCWSKKCEIVRECELRKDRCLRTDPGYPWFNLDRACNEDGCGCYRKCRQKNWCKKKNGICRPTSPGSSYVALEKLCKEGCYCWVKDQQDPGCPEGECPLDTDVCSKISPGSSWSNIGENGKCSGNDCTCWRQCEQDDNCSKRQGECFAQDPGDRYEFIGDCKTGCKCYRPCHDEECVTRGGKCSTEDPSPVGQSLYTRDGVCKGECVCWVPKQTDCPKGACKLDTDKCAKTSPGGNLWSNIGQHEICRDDCTCWRECEQVNVCIAQLGECLGEAPGTDFEMIDGDCKDGCKCWRSCNDEACILVGGKCYPDGFPIPNWEKIGPCKGSCSCYRPPNSDLE